MEHGEQVGELPGFHKVERTVVIVKADDNDWCEFIRLMISEEMEMMWLWKSKTKGSTFDLCVAGGEEMVIEGPLDQQA